MTKKGYGKVLQAQNYVGVIQTKDGTTIEILPKIQEISIEESKKILIKMLKTLKKSPFKNFNMAHLKPDSMPLLEIFITMFLDELSMLIKKGIKSDYVTQEENLAYLKGKLQMKEQIARNSIHKERFFVAYDEYVSNRVENRLIKTTLQYLYKQSKTNSNKKRIREYLFVFDEVGVSHAVKSDFAKVKLGRQMKDYEQILIWVKTFLLEHSYSPYKGSDLAFALLFDMNLLFESYVGHYLKKNGQKRKYDVSLQDKQHHLVYSEQKGIYSLRPDIVIDDGTAIADTKWKILSKEKTRQGIAGSDLYQMYAYGTKYNNCKKLYMIYPKDTQTTLPIYNYHEDKSLPLSILFFDLQSKTLTPQIFI
ncbi:MAG: restriction endonuclease [Sulfurovum sp.]|nr:MAG: restriction endonuclease [Sulfurovum sp.]